MVAGFAALIWLWDQHPQLHRLGKAGSPGAGGEKKQSALSLGGARGVNPEPCGIMLLQLRRGFLILRKLQSTPNGGSSSCTLKLRCILLEHSRGMSRPC